MLLDNVLERSGLVQSGIIRTARYYPTENHEDNPIVTNNAELDNCKLKLRVFWEDLSMCFRGTEWSRSRDQVLFDNPHRIVKENYEAEYSEIPQPNGEIGKIYYVTPKEADMSDYLESPFTIFIAGRLQTDLICDYIRNHKSDARDMGQVTLSNGDVTRHIQFTIPKRFYSKLREYRTSNKIDIYDFDFMLLNIYVMPEKGYVVRRIDECIPDGTVRLRFESLDFVDCGNGIFFPKEFSKIVVGYENRLRVIKYEIKEALLLNEPIPDEYFDRKLSKGTTIRDWRDSSVDENGRPRFFATLRDGMATEIDELYNEWKAAQDKKKKEKELNNKTNPIQPVIDIDSKISENLPIVENKNNSKYSYYISAVLFFTAVILVFFLYRRYSNKTKL
ncbi:MAG: hypothetical protein LBQ66_13650 [Planctomycetaceae bacterium]|nr:hypothetical protein [Planctomycetaceae bacterium]